MKKRVSLFLLISWLPSVVAAQIHYSPSPKKVNRQLEQWVDGQVTFVDGTVLDTRFAYNPLVPEGMLKIKHEGKIIAGTVREVESFRWYDSTTALERQFVSFSVNNQAAFVEILRNDLHYMLLGRPSVRVTVYSSYGTNSSDIRGKYYRYLYIKNTQEVHLLTNKTLLTLIPDRKREIRKYLRTHRSTMETTQLYANVIERFMDFVNK